MQKQVQQATLGQVLMNMFWNVWIMVVSTAGLSCLLYLAALGAVGLFTKRIDINMLKLF